MSIRAKFDISKEKRNDPQPQILTTEGHFCSLLISNIILNPLFLFHSPLFVKITTPKHSIFYFSSENKLCFPDALLLPKAVVFLKVYRLFIQDPLSLFKPSAKPSLDFLGLLHWLTSTFLLSHSLKTTEFFNLC